MTATSIMCSGVNAAKALKMFEHMNLQMFSSRTYTRLQSLYVAPSATVTWDSEQATLLQDMHNRPLVLGGDARCDSPGYSAKYGSYYCTRWCNIQWLESGISAWREHLEVHVLKHLQSFCRVDTTTHDGCCCTTDLWYWEVMLGVTPLGTLPSMVHILSWTWWPRIFWISNCYRCVCLIFLMLRSN
jgi:hypothetical protein